MTDAARVLLTAAVLAGTGLGAYAFRLERTDAESHERLLGQLRLANVMAVMLAAAGALFVGLGLANGAFPGTGLDVAMGVAFVAAGAVGLSRAPRDGLFFVACGFLLHALTAIAHRPGWLAPELAPRWHLVGVAAFDLYLAAVCYWGRRR